MVSSLIDKDTKWWKVDVVNFLFLPFEASTVLSIPLSYNLPEDSLIWIGNKSGTFIVKSVYHIASSIVKPSDEGECLSSNSSSQLWKRIWHQKVPPKLKVFAWRLCVNGLPTMQNLSHRGINCSSICPICDKAIETTAYAPFHCDHAKLTWAHWFNCPVELSNPPLPRSPHAPNWQAPSLGFFKINIDGAASNDGTNSTIGVIIRDNQGNPIAASNKILPSPYTAKITKAVAFLHKVLLASKMKIFHAIFEFDALSIVQALNQGVVGGEIRLILHDIRIFSTSFSWCSFQHLKRDGNRVAHELAKAARLSGTSQIWKGVNPSCVEHLRQEDI